MQCSKIEVLKWSLQVFNDFMTNSKETAKVILIPNYHCLRPPDVYHQT